MMVRFLLINIGYNVNVTYINKLSTIEYTDRGNGIKYHFYFSRDDKKKANVNRVVISKNGWNEHSQEEMDEMAKDLNKLFQK